LELQEFELPHAWFQNLEYSWRAFCTCYVDHRCGWFCESMRNVRRECTNQCPHTFRTLSPHFTHTCCTLSQNASRTLHTIWDKQVCEKTQSSARTLPARIPADFAHTFHTGSQKAHPCLLHTFLGGFLSMCFGTFNKVEKWKLPELVGLVDKTLVDPVRVFCPT